MKKFFKIIDLFHFASFGCILVLGYLYSVSTLNIGLVLVSLFFLGLAVMTAIHHAETIAKRVGPSIGTLILAIAVTVIEVGLILSMMATASEGGSFIARDTVFSAVIVVANGITGFCFLLGGLRYKELGFQTEGTSSLLAVLATLVGVTLVLPNFTVSTPGPTYSSAQLIFVSAASIFLYIALVWTQTVTHKDYFADSEASPVAAADIPSNSTMIWSALTLVISLIAVIGLAKLLSPSIETGLAAIGAPKAAVGIVLALLVLLPEAGAALSAARSNQLQSSLNLALGSGAASVALTIPAISIYSIMTGEQVSLGLDSKGISFLLLTFIVSSLTLVTGKTSALKGIVHLVILFSYIALSFMP